MKKMVLRIAVAALLVPSASAVAMQERLRSAGSAARARMQQMRESVAKNTKCLSEWTGSLMADVGRAIKKRDLDKIPEIIKRHKKKAAGIIGTAAVLAGIGLLVRTVRSAPSSMPTGSSAQLAVQESAALRAQQKAITKASRQRATAAREAAARKAREHARQQAAGYTLPPRVSGAGAGIGSGWPMYLGPAGHFSTPEITVDIDDDSDVD